MKSDIEKRLKALERKRIYLISNLADWAILNARRERGYPEPEVIEWNVEFKAQFDKCFGHKPKR